MKKRSFILVLLFLTLGFAQGNAVWKGFDVGDAWKTPSNWSTGALPLAAEKVQINDVSAQTCILDSDAGVTIGALAIGDNGGPVSMEIKAGGYLTVGDWTAIGYKRSSSLTISGGTMVCLSHCSVAMFDDFDATMDLTITSGALIVQNTFYHGKTFDGLPGVTVNVHTQLDGGRLEVDDIQLNTGVMDITGGTLIIGGNATGKIDTYKGDGRMTAYGGTGSLVYDYNVTNIGQTTVTASETPEPVSYPSFPPGDLDDDYDVDIEDLSLLLGNWLNPDFPVNIDINGDNDVNAGDLTEMSSYWGHKSRNVVFIVIDDLNTTMGCYGHPLVQTPYMDSLAAGGIRFENALCNYAVCNPSRSSFLTGLRPDTTQIFDNVVHYADNLADRVSLPQLFRNNGYYTKRLGKVFNAGADQQDALAWDDEGDPGSTALGKTGVGRNMTDGALSWCSWLAANGGDEDQSDGNIAAQAVSFLNQSHDRPFFLALGFHKPHDPFNAPASYFDMYPLEVCNPPIVPAWWDPLDCLSIPCSSLSIFDAFTDQDKREFLRAYYACTTFVDAQVGKVIQALENNSLMDNTTIFLFGDHGYHLGEQRHWNKVTVFERSHRAPFIVVSPDAQAPAGSVTEEIVEFVDFYPTLADICRLKDVPNDLEGISFSPLLNDPATPWKQAGYIQVQRSGVMGRAIQTQRWRYVEWEDASHSKELYDHTTDPAEYFNLAGDGAYTDDMIVLQELLHNGQNRLK